MRTKPFLHMFIVAACRAYEIRNAKSTWGTSLYAAEIQKLSSYAD